MIDSRQLARIRRRVLGGHLHGLGYEPSKKEYRAKVGLQLRYVSFDVAKYGKAFDVSIALHFDFLPPFDFPVWPGARVPAEMCGQLCAFQRLVRSHSGSQYYECGETEAAAAILVFFLHKLVSREFAPYLRSHDYYPIRDIERLLAAFERNINDHPGAAVLYGQPVVFALICRAVWDGIARASTSSASSASAMVLPVNIYGDNLAPVAAHMHELWAVRDFLFPPEAQLATGGEPGAALRRGDDGVPRYRQANVQRQSICAQWA